MSKKLLMALLSRSGLGITIVGEALLVNLKNAKKVKPRILNLILDRVKKIEALSYPEAYRAFEEFTTIEDLEEYAEIPLDRINVVIGNGFYGVITTEGETAEVVDIARNPESNDRFPFVSLLKWMQEMGIKTVTGDAREATSWRAIRVWAKRRRKELKYSPWEWEGEIFNNFSLSLTKDGEVTEVAEGEVQ